MSKCFIIIKSPLPLRLEAFAVLKLKMEGMDSCVGLYFGVVIP